MTFRTTLSPAVANVLGSAIAIVLSAGCGKKGDPAPATTGAAAAPGAKAQAPAPTKASEPRAESTGVAFEGTVGSTAFSLALNKASIEARPKGSPLAVWNCIPALGRASVTDFTIGDDPKRSGEIFVASVATEGLARLEPEKEVKAQIQYRRAGEPTPKTVKGTMVWKADLLSGSASGTAADGETVTLSWTCETN